MAGPIESPAEQRVERHVARIVEQLAEARASRRPLAIVGGASKTFMGREIDAAPLDVAGLAGIVDYAPGELVLTARAGTTIAEIDAALAANDQMLGAEPPAFGGAATLGGTLASNLSGPGRPWRGAIRDAVLGVELINGRGERMRFGGRVMKNVAGFDVSRLQAGAFGAFGVLTEISLKVVPRPASTLTLAETLDAGGAIRRMNSLAGRAKPLTAAAWVDGRLYLRLSGSESAVAGTAVQWDLETVQNGDGFWRDLAEQRMRFFDDPQPLWRFSVRPSAPLAPLSGDWLIDWGGAQRFIHGDFDKARMESLAEAGGGHATLYRGGDRRGEVHHALPEAMRALHVRLKDAFDPDRILNPGRLYGFI